MGTSNAPTMAVSRFVVVEYAGDGLPLSDWTKAFPGTTVDMILEPMRAQGADLHIPGTVLGRGMDAKAMAVFQQMLDGTYAPYASVRTDVRRGEWLGRITIHVEKLVKSPAARAVALHQQHLGAPWSHVEQGIVYMRLRVPDAQDAEAIVQNLRSELVTQGAEAQVSLQVISPRDYGVWEELIQAAIGLRP